MADSVPARDTGAAEEAADKAGGTAIETLPSSIAHREEEKEGEEVSSGAPPRPARITEDDRLRAYREHERAYQHILDYQQEQSARLVHFLQRRRSGPDPQRPLQPPYASAYRQTPAGVPSTGNVAGPPQFIDEPPLSAQVYRQAPADRLPGAIALSQRQHLVPIRIDIDTDGIRIADTFTWDLYEADLSPEMFANLLVTDLQIGEHAHLAAALVAAQIREQLREKASFGDDAAHTLSGQGRMAGPSTEVTAGQAERTNDLDEDRRFIVKLNITIGSIILIDQFEWNLNNERGHAEAFAHLLAQELGLGGDFTSAISHAIREQCEQQRRTCLLSGTLKDGESIALYDEDGNDLFLPAVTTSIRSAKQVEDFTPFLVDNTEAERAELEKSNAKARKRRGRTGRRIGGPIRTEPNQAGQKTHRTPIGLHHPIRPTFQGSDVLPDEYLNR